MKRCLTIVVKNRQPLLGRLVMLPEPRVELSELGQAIWFNELKKISKYYPNVEVWKTCIMPDHIHILVNVTEPFPEKKNLVMWFPASRWVASMPIAAFAA